MGNRIVLAWTVESMRLADCTFRYDRYYRGFQKLGWNPVVVATKAAADGMSIPVQTVDRPDVFDDPDFWAGLDAKVGLITTWLDRGRHLSAMRTANMTTMALSDFDGYATPRSHPREYLKRMWLYQPTASLKVRAAAFWLRRYLFAASDIRAVLESARQSDALILHSSGAIANLRRFTDRYDPTCANQMHIVPYPIDEIFCGSDPAVSVRSNRFVAVARWDDPQKDPRLMVRILETYYSGGGTSEAVLVGRKGERWFHPLCQRWPQVRYVGVVSPEKLRDLFLTSRVILFTSRWETGPIAAGEALASGCTLVGPPLLNFVTYHLTGPYGEVSRTRSPVELASVLNRELTRWERGERDPSATARVWRDRLSVENVCRALLGTVGLATADVS